MKKIVNRQNLLVLTLAATLYVPAHATDNTLTAIDSNAAVPVTIIEQELDPLIGSWLVTMENSGNRQKSTALYSFFTGGVMTQTENPMTDPMLGNLVFSSAHGAWEYDAENDSYQVRYFKLVYQADASFAGPEESIGTIKLDSDDQLTGTVSFGGDQQTVLTGKKIAPLARAPSQQKQ